MNDNEGSLPGKKADKKEGSHPYFSMGVVPPWENTQQKLTLVCGSHINSGSGTIRKNRKAVSRGRVDYQVLHTTWHKTPAKSASTTLGTGVRRRSSACISAKGRVMNT